MERDNRFGEVGAMKSLLCGTDGIMDYPGLLNIGELSVIDAPRAAAGVQPCIRKYLLFSGVNRCVNHPRLRRSGCIRTTFNLASLFFFFFYNKIYLYYH